MFITPQLKIFYYILFLYCRSSLSVIAQDPFLFTGSVRENLDPHYIKSDAEIWKALKHCHMEEKIQNLGGLDVRIEEMGQNFSNGERQLICLARALLQRAKVSIHILYHIYYNKI